MDEELLQDDQHRRIVRIGDTVRRPVHSWSGSVHELLLYLETVGFSYSPRFLGFDSEGREVLSFIAGESGAVGWYKVLSDDGLRAFARLLKEYHEAVSGFRPTSNQWAAGNVPMKPEELVSHGDFGPWNVVWQGDQPVGLIDWDYAHPGPAWFDVAYALEYVAPFRNDELCLSWMHHPSVPDRRRRLRTFVEACGSDPSLDWAERVIRTQEEGLGLVGQLAASGAEPQATWVSKGYLDELNDLVSWSRHNRHLF